MGLLRGVRRQLVYDQRVLQRYVQDLFERQLQRQLVERLERCGLGQLQRSFIERLEQLGLEQLRWNHFVRVCSAAAGVRRHERLGFAILGLLQAGVRVDRERLRNAGHELLEFQCQSGE